jgi:hypothetical protein
MRIQSQPFPRRESGYALIMIMCFLAVSLVIFASMMYWVSTNSNITQRNNAFNQAEAAAESCTENSLAYMMRDYAFGSLNAASSYGTLTTSQTGWPIQYNFSNIGISISPTNWTELTGQYSNLWGYVQSVTNVATATATTGPVAVPATVEQDLQFASIPLFQYAIFYNMNLEICPGAAMTINGHVHSNNNIYSTGDGPTQPLTYSDLVDASGTYTNSRSPSDPQSWSPGNINFSITQNNPLNNVDSLTMPIGTNNNPAGVSAILGLPPSNLIAPNAAAYSPTGSVYLYNGADLIITNNAGGTNFTVFYDNQYNTPQLTPVPPDLQIITNNNSGAHGSTVYFTNYVYSFITNATFYDYRESDTVKAIQIDVAKLDAWLTNNTTTGGTNRGGSQYNTINTTGSTSKGHGINSIYVYNSVPLTASQLPAVRLVNGKQLPAAGLTVATAQPLYVEGNYNVTTNGSTYAYGLGSTTNGATVPAAIMGDAITVLSTNWSDSYSLNNTTDNTDGSGPNNRNATATTVNAAALEGIVQSFTDSYGKHYSGGVENFLRLLENWSGDTLTYNGSIVVLFPSQYATNLWIGPGTYYNPPNRQWGFDVNFLKGQQYQPPLTPQAKKIIRSSWAAW